MLRSARLMMMLLWWKQLAALLTIPVWRSTCVMKEKEYLCDEGRCCSVWDLYSCCTDVSKSLLSSRPEIRDSQLYFNVFSFFNLLALRAAACDTRLRCRDGDTVTIELDAGRLRFFINGEVSWIAFLLCSLLHERRGHRASCMICAVFFLLHLLRGEEISWVAEYDWRQAMFWEAASDEYDWRQAMWALRGGQAPNCGQRQYTILTGLNGSIQISPKICELQIVSIKTTSLKHHRWPQSCRTVRDMHRLGKSLMVVLDRNSQEFPLSTKTNCRGT